MEEIIPKLLLRKSSLQLLCFGVYDFEAMILVTDNQSKVEKLRNSKDNSFPKKSREYTLTRIALIALFGCIYRNENIKS